MAELSINDIRKELTKLRKGDVPKPKTKTAKAGTSKAAKETESSVAAKELREAKKDKKNSVLHMEFDSDEGEEMESKVIHAAIQQVC